MSGEFLAVMTFIGTVIVLIFDVLSQVHFGEYSLLTIFGSFALFRVVIWFLARYFNIGIDSGIQASIDQGVKPAIGDMRRTINAKVKVYQGNKQRKRDREGRF